MKPTSAMFNRLRLRPVAPSGEAAPVEKAPPVEEPQAKGSKGAKASKARAAAAREAPSVETEAEPRLLPGEFPGRQRLNELMESLGRASTLQERTVLMEELATLAPERAGRIRRNLDVGLGVGGERGPTLQPPSIPSTPGQVSVRVTGTDERVGLIPLEGLRVRVTAGRKHAAEGVTDELGQALLPFDAEGKFDVEVLSAEGKTLERAKGELPAGESAFVELSVTKRTGLEERFARGEAFLEATRRRTEREVSRARDPYVLEQRVANLEATVARLEQALAQLSRSDTNDSKGGAR